MNAYIDAMKNYANFSGRATRSQFWLFMLVFIIMYIVSAGVDAVFFPFLRNMGPIRLVVTLAHMLPVWAIQARRLHDTDKSGWWALISLTGIGVLVLLVFYCTKSTVGPNSFSGGSSTQTANYTTSSFASSGLQSASKLERLEKLVALKSSGALSDVEFQQMKSDLLNQKS